MPAEAAKAPAGANPETSRNGVSLTHGVVSVFRRRQPLEIVEEGLAAARNAVHFRQGTSCTDRELPSGRRS